MNLIEDKLRIVIDNTNVATADRARYIMPAKNAGFKITGYYFIPDVHGCITRNRGRIEGRVPDIAIFTANKRLEAPRIDEGYDELYEVRLVNNDFIVTSME
jgi:predicted kinase